MREITPSLERSCPYSGEEGRKEEGRKEGKKGGRKEGGKREIDCQHHPRKRELPDW